MLRTARARARTLDNSTTIELTIPLHSSSADSCGGTCYICANDFCDDDVCCRSLTHLKCCTQAVCCGCLGKMIKRCKCEDECEAVIALCPFCREVSPVDVLDVFLGHVPACKVCVTADDDVAKSPPVHEQPEPEPQDDA